MNYTGIVIGAGTFLIIGLLHPVVIKTEYYFGTKVWPVYLVAGLLCIGASVFVDNIIAASLSAVLGFSLLWGIHELFEQEQRVKRGWFPTNPNRKK